jgi:hypothetical protein
MVELPSVLREFKKNSNLNEPANLKEQQTQRTSTLK